MDLFEDPAGPEDSGPDNAHDFTVSEISGAVRRTLEDEFGRVRVRGEVGRVVSARTGHLYFDLKDERNVLAAVSWRMQAVRLTYRPEEGMEVVATGRLTTYGPQSKYQLIVEDVRPAGAGALMAMLEARRKALGAEGLFDPARKRPLPYLPAVIGVITSPTGAVIRDILHRLSDRFPRRVLVWPVAVQGRDCAAQVAAAIEGFNRLPQDGPIPRPDVLIVARGGGSIEDLWGFNEEVVVRAAAASSIPLVSAVGHETDTTLIDHAAHVRAPTPTAAAELAVPVRMELRAAVAGLQSRLVHCAGARVAERRQRLADLGRALPRGDALAAPWRQRLDMAAGRLDGALRHAAQAKAVELARLSLRPAALAARARSERHRLDGTSRRLTPCYADRVGRARERLAGVDLRLEPAIVAQVGRTRERYEGHKRLLKTLGYQATLDRGFAVVWDGGRVVTEAAAAMKATSLELQFCDGRVPVVRPGAAPRRRSSDPDPEQGSLL